MWNDSETPLPRFQEWSFHVKIVQNVQYVSWVQNASSILWWRLKLNSLKASWAQQGQDEADFHWLWDGWLEDWFLSMLLWSILSLESEYRTIWSSGAWSSQKQELNQEKSPEFYPDLFRYSTILNLNMSEKNSQTACNLVLSCSIHLPAFLGVVPNSAQLQLLSVDGHAKGQQDTYALNGTSCKTLGSKNLVPRCPKYPMRKEELHANRSKKIHKHTSILAQIVYLLL